jgi:hypothetical protein
MRHPRWEPHHPRRLAPSFPRGGDHPDRERLDLGLGQGSLAGLDDDFERDGLGALGHARSLVHVEHATSAISVLSAPAAARTRSPAGRSWGHEGEVAGERLEGRERERALGLGGFALGLRHGVEEELEPEHGPAASMAASTRGCSSPNSTSVFLGRARSRRSPGVPPRRGAALGGLQRGDRRVQFGQECEHVGLELEQRVAALAGPGAGPVRAEQAGDDGALFAGRVAGEHGADLEQRRVGEAPGGVAARRLRSDWAGSTAAWPRGRPRSGSPASARERRRRTGPAQSWRMKLQVTAST